MSFKVSELLNPAPSSDPSSPKPQPEDLPPQRSPYSPQNKSPVATHHSRNSSHGNHVPENIDHDAANALADLATSGPLPISPLDRVNLQSPTRQAHQANYSQSPPHPSTSYSLAAVPVEPSPPLERAQQPFSPTLEQYHHSSRSSDRQRRQSWISTRSSPPPRLAPMQSRPEMEAEQEVLDSVGRTTKVTTTVASSPKAEKMEDVQHTGEGLGLSQVNHAPLAEPIPQLAPDLAPVAQMIKPLEPSPPPTQVKAEPAATPRDSTPQTPLPLGLRYDDKSIQETSAADDSEPPKQTANLKQEESTISLSGEGVAAQKAMAATIAGKKRAAPKSGAKSEKKATPNSIKKPAAKRRRLESESFEPTPSSRRSATPASRASKTPAPRNRKHASATPASSSPAPSHANDVGMDEDEEMADVDGDYEEGAELFCICRKPDNHTWMIGCDGGCEDWFHGKCVEIKEEDGDLIDKYICKSNILPTYVRALANAGFRQVRIARKI